jgi:hypothetical protein
VPASTISGGPLRAEVRQAVDAQRLDLAFQKPLANRTSNLQVAQTPTRRSSKALVEPGTAPVGISVAGVGIDGPVEAVGIASDHQLDVPHAQTAGWYRHSATPHWPGTTVIAAHVDFGGQPGLFYNLRLATVGDLIRLELADGTYAEYAVSSVVLYDKTELPAHELFRSGGSHALHLVTCGGSFDQIARSYRGNQVITATPVST